MQIVVMKKTAKRGGNELAIHSGTARAGCKMVRGTGIFRGMVDLMQVFKSSRSNHTPKEQLSVLYMPTAGYCRYPGSLYQFLV